MTPTKRRARRPARKRKRPSAPLIRTSERTTFKRCRWQWDRNYNDKLKPRLEAPALRFGTLIHKALEVYMPPGKKRGPKPAKTFAKEYDKQVANAEAEFNIKLHEDEEWVDARELGIEMMNNYVEEYGRDEEWEVIASEKTFKVPVYAPPFPDGEGGYMNLKGEPIDRRRVLFYYVGTIDSVWRSRIDGSIWLNDYKTTANDPVKDGAKKNVLDEQATAYWTWGVDFLIKEGLLKEREIEMLAGMVYTMLKKAKKDPRPRNAQGHCLNKDGSVSQKQPTKLFHREVVHRSEADREHARVRAIQEVSDMIAVKSGRSAVYKNPDTGSMGHCGYCPVRDLCELHEAGANWEDLRDVSMTTWEPYASHEIKGEGKER
jgi:hypothetical protein